MNKDINVAEILKTKEKGTKLYDIVRDIDVYLYNIVGENDEITVREHKANRFIIPRNDINLSWEDEPIQVKLVKV